MPILQPRQILFCCCSNMFLVFYIIAVSLRCIKQFSFLLFSVEWVQFRLIYNLLPSYKICFPQLFFFNLISLSEFAWVCVCVSLNLFLLTSSKWYIYINIYWLWFLKRNLGRKCTINNRPFYLAQFLLFLSLSQSLARVMIK